MSLLLTLIVLAIAGVVVNAIPMDAFLKRICFLVVGFAVLVFLLRLLFPGSI